MLSHERVVNGDIKTEKQEEILTKDSKKNLKKTKAKVKKIKRVSLINIFERLIFYMLILLSVILFYFIYIFKIVKNRFQIFVLKIFIFFLNFPPYTT